jgi:hypothetical protein
MRDIHRKEQTNPFTQMECEIQQQLSHRDTPLSAVSPLSIGGKESITDNTNPALLFSPLLLARISSLPVRSEF